MSQSPSLEAQRSGVLGTEGRETVKKNVEGEEFKIQHKSVINS